MPIGKNTILIDATKSLFEQLSCLNVYYMIFRCNFEVTEICICKFDLR